MNKKLFIVIILSALLISGTGFSQQRILVMGFQAENLNSIQNRLLQETIMRKLLQKGFSIVPVMEVENFFQENSRAKIRSQDFSLQKRYAQEMNSKLVISGTLKVVKNRDFHYKATVFYYYPRTKKIKKNSEIIIVKGNYYNFFDAVSEVVVKSLRRFN